MNINFNLVLSDGTVRALHTIDGEEYEGTLYPKGQAPSLDDFRRELLTEQARILAEANRKSLASGCDVDTLHRNSAEIRCIVQALREWEGRAL